MTISTLIRGIKTLATGGYIIAVCLNLSCSQKALPPVLKLEIYALNWDIKTIVPITAQSIKEEPGLYITVIDDPGITDSLISLLDSLEPVEGYVSGTRLLCEIYYRNKKTDILEIGDNQIVWLNGQPHQPHPALLRFFLNLIPKEQAPRNIFTSKIPSKPRPATLKDKQTLDSLINIILHN